MSLCSDIDMRMLERGETRAYHLSFGGVMNAMFGETENRAIDGQVVKFNVPFAYKNETVLFKPNAFGDLTNDRIGFRVDHLDSSEVASTDDALTLVADDDAVQFRLTLHNCFRGSLIARMYEVDSRASTSVGCNILEEHRETIGGQSIRVITRAKMTEVSICRDGAAPDAFAVLVDTRFTPPPEAGSRTATFKAAHVLHRAARKLRSLKAQVTAAYGNSPTPKRSLTLNQLNRMQSEETALLQKRAQRANGI